MVERVSGISFIEFIHQRFTEPLKLNHTKTPQDKWTEWLYLLINFMKMFLRQNSSISNISLPVAALEPLSPVVQILSPAYTVYSAFAVRDYILKERLQTYLE